MSVGSDRVRERPRGPRGDGRVPSHRGAERKAGRAAIGGATTLKSVEKALVLLGLLASQGPLTAQTLGVKLSIPRSSLYRFLHTLSRLRVVETDGAGRFRLSPLFFSLGSAALNGLDIRSVAFPHMLQLSEEAEESAYLLVERDLQALVIEKILFPGGLRLNLYVGDRVPLYGGGLPKLLLAHLPAEAQERVLSGKIERLAPGTITDPRVLREQLGRLREQGYAVSDQEVFPDVRAIGAVVRNSRGDAVASVGVAGYLPNLPDRRLPELIRAVVGYADAISSDLGHLPGSTGHSHARTQTRRA